MLAQLMQGKGEVIALDRSHAKVDDIRALAEELGCAGCVQAYKMDATKLVAKQRDSSADVQQQQGEPQQQQQGEPQQQQLSQADQQLAQQEQQQQQQPPQPQQEQQQQQQGQPPLLSTTGLSAKAQARLQRRIAAMAARGQAPSAGEYRWASSLADSRCTVYLQHTFSWLNCVFDVYS
jgi:Mg-chelatase subunit ChlI